MNLGDGLLFQLENGKPRLMLVSRATEKAPLKQQFSFRSRAAAAVLSSSLEPLPPPAGKSRNAPIGGGANTSTGTPTKAASTRLKRKTAAALGANENAVVAESSAMLLAKEADIKDLPTNRNAGKEERVVTLTNETLQKTLRSWGAEPGMCGAKSVEQTGIQRGEPAIATSSNDERRPRDGSRASPSAPPPPAGGSSLCLLWEVGSSGHPTRTSYLRSMTSLLDPAQLEERERRRMKQKEQQRNIQEQMEERQRWREREESERRREQEEEERRLQVERDEIQRFYQQEVLKERQKLERLQEEDQEDKRLQENQEKAQMEFVDEGGVEIQEKEEPWCESSCSGHPDGLSPSSGVCAALEESDGLRRNCSLKDGAEQNDRPPTDCRKENLCIPPDPEKRNQRTQSRPEWNTHRTSRRFVPASERYPLQLQKNRQENRQRRQVELLALQERSCLSRNEPPPPPHQDKECLLYSRSSLKEETYDERQKHSNRGRSPLVLTPAPEFVPYVRTCEVFHLNSTDPPGSPAPPPDDGAPLPTTHTHRQQEILRGLAQLRQGLFLRQRELEKDLTPPTHRL